jgi:hypothetical protein
MNARALDPSASLGVRRASNERARPLRPLAVLAVAFGAAAILGAQQPKQPLTNDNVAAMTKAGIAEATIVKMIEEGGTEFDTSPDALIALKNAGVGHRVIDAMVSAERPKAGTSANGLYPQPEEVGVYVNLRERLVPLKIEIITWRSGGAAKQALTFSRGHVNALVSKPMSAVRLESSPIPEFIIYCPEGFSAEEYQLLRFWEKKDRREFRLATGGVIHASSGADMNAMKLDVDRLGPRFYRVAPAYPLQKGEYGFLPPGAALSASAASAGKIYTFAITPAK